MGFVGALGVETPFALSTNRGREYENVKHVNVKHVLWAECTFENGRRDQELPYNGVH